MIDSTHPVDPSAPAPYVPPAPRPELLANPGHASAVRVGVLEQENAALRQQVQNLQTQSGSLSAAEAEKLRGENQALSAHLKSLEAERTLLAEDERVIAQKLAVGLSRAQAVAVIKRQRAWDDSPHGKARAAQVARKLGRATVAVSGAGPA